MKKDISGLNSNSAARQTMPAGSERIKKRRPSGRPVEIRGVEPLTS